MLSEFFKIKFVVCIVFSFYPRQGLCGLFCPMCLLCDISGRMGEGCAYASCCYEVAPLTLRAKLRAEQRIQVRNSFPASCTPVIQAWSWGRGVRNTLSRKGTFLVRRWARGIFDLFGEKGRGPPFPEMGWCMTLHKQPLKIIWPSPTYSTQEEAEVKITNRKN